MTVDDEGGPGGVLLAALRLPVKVLAEGSALGLQAGSRFGAADVDVRVPAAQEPDVELDTDDMSLALAESEGGHGPATTRRILRDWVQPVDAPVPAQLGIHRLLVRVNGPTGDLAPPRPGVGPDLLDRLSDELFRTANRWLDVFRSWIEVVTIQDLDHLQPRWTAHIEGATVATFSPDGDRLGRGGMLRLDSRFDEPAPALLVAHAITAAGRDEYPPLAHAVLRDARAAYYRAQPRKAILDAATATEISLTAVADRRGLIPPGTFMMLGRLVSALERDGFLEGAVAEELQALVVDPRNKAIHEGLVTLTNWDVAEACKAAQRIVLAAFPVEL